MNLKEIDVPLDAAASDPTEVPGTAGQPVSDFRVISLPSAALGSLTLQLGQGGNRLHPFGNFGLENMCPRYTGGIYFTNPTAIAGGVLRLHVMIDGGATLGAPA